MFEVCGNRETGLLTSSGVDQGSHVTLKQLQINESVNQMSRDRSQRSRHGCSWDWYSIDRRSGSSECLVQQLTFILSLLLWFVEFYWQNFTPPCCLSHSYHVRSCCSPAHLTGGSWETLFSGRSPSCALCSAVFVLSCGLNCSLWLLCSLCLMFFF